MSLPRSKSAPSLPVPRSQSVPSPRRQCLHLTAVDTSAQPSLTSPLRDVEEDPFSLAGFFPSLPGSPRVDHDWLRPASDEELERPPRHLTDFDPVPDLTDRSTYVAAQGGSERDSLDEYAKEVIETEDKLGILSLSSEKLLSLLPTLGLERYSTEDTALPLTPYSAEDPVDIESVYAAQCLRREASMVGAETAGVAPRPSRVATWSLFLSRDGVGARPRTEGWVESVWRQVGRLTGFE